MEKLTTKIEIDDETVTIDHRLAQYFPVRGCPVVSFIVMESGKVLYGGGDTAEGHAGLYEFAKDLELVDEDDEPVSGGIINTRHWRYDRRSHCYGQARKKIIEGLMTELENLV